MWTEEQLEMLISAEANALWEKLRCFAPKNRLFIAAEIMNRLTRKLRSRESSNIPLDFTADEFPTLPEAKRSVPDLSDRETRAIKTSDLELLRQKAKDEGTK